MSYARFDAISTSPRARTPSGPRYPSAFVHGNTFALPSSPDNLAGLSDDPFNMNSTSNRQAQHSFAHITNEDVGEHGRFTRWLEKTQMEQEKKYNRTVTISPLPDSLTVADVLPRVRGGVESCYISQFEENRIAIVTFKLPADAITYAEFCAETPVWGLWTFQISRPGVPFTWERRAKVQLYKTAPGMGTVWNRGDIPTEPRTVVPAGSRCLVYKECKPYEVAGIYRALDLHNSQHQKDQVEGMWLDGPVRDQNGAPIYGDLHVWYTSMRAAQEAKLRVVQLEYEYDPCSDGPEKLILNLDEGEVRIFRHHEPFVDLLALDSKSLLAFTFEGVIDPVQAFWQCRTPLLSIPDTGITGRLQWSLNNLQTGTLPPPAPLSDPFTDTRVTTTGLCTSSIANHAPQQPKPGPASYSLSGFNQNVASLCQSFTANRNALPGYHLSPLEAYVARTQERQALGFPPYSGARHTEQPYRAIGPPSNFANNSSSGGIGSSNTGGNCCNPNHNYSNLGGLNPQSGRQPRSGFYDS
ncbi:hypothetical protein J7T55_015479 [Diaporthe amygdali]|uniref:uncharacterized protein n=1 Tax=Phomopsis amygdali TaxID=1214568 RepID=UPI0022FEC7E3|nr:uncharacterized protein J7T55_015479 [Diaporthe amygdali]KAJ0120747.1 hypothetical protein J7T55_015479 [Diaporthe amygdali]